MQERIAIVEGLRTPFAKAGDELKTVQADDLGAGIVREVMDRVDVARSDVDEVIIGNVAQPAHAANIARVVALKAGFSESVIAHTVHRNCASGMQSITAAAGQIATGESRIVVAGGTESMSHIPLMYGPEMTELFQRLFRARSARARLAALCSFRPKFLKPIIGVMQGLTDPVCGLNMGQTAEVLSKEFHITQEEQDAYALQSHLRALDAIKEGRLSEEIHPVPIPPRYDSMLEADSGPRDGQTIEALAKLRPYFDRHNGTVTVGNACPITDGAAAVVLMSESEAKQRGLPRLGYLREYAYAGLEPNRMGLGPVYATAKVLDRAGLSLSDIDLIELNEAFAAQVLACVKAFESDSFAQTYLGRESALGRIQMDRLNVNGGAIALGHPVGTTGTRLVVTLLREMQRRGLNRGLATLCIGGGQGAALILERD